VIKELILGKLNWSDLPHEWFTIGGTASLIAMALNRSGNLNIPQALEMVVERMVNLN